MGATTCECTAGLGQFRVRCLRRADAALSVSVPLRVLMVGAQLVSITVSLGGMGCGCDCVQGYSGTGAILVRCLRRSDGALSVSVLLLVLMHTLLVVEPLLWGVQFNLYFIVV